MYILAVFRSRTQTMEFCQELRREGVLFQTVTTPAAASTGCSLSCKFSLRDLAKVKRMLSQRRFSAFSGLFQTHGNAYGANDFVRIL